MARMPLSIGRLPRLAALTLASLAAAALPGPARADALDGCATRALEHPFAPWLDGDSYFLAPGGTMEASLTGWTLRGGAKMVSGSEPFGASGARGRWALSLPSGSSATTPAVCMGVLYPTLRYFAANDGGLLSVLRVDMLYQGSNGTVLTLPLGVEAGGRAWAPSLPAVVGANLFSPLSDGQARVAFRFSPAGLGASWRIDDVYVDPMARH